MNYRAALFFALAIIASTLAASARTLTFMDVRRIVTISDPQISPNGKEIAYIRHRTNFSADRYRGDLMLINVRNRNARQLTFGRRGVSSPRWSPQGDRLAFIAQTSGKESQSQIFIAPMNGGDAMQLTHEKTGVERFSWSPDGQRIAFVAQDENPNKNAIRQHLDAFEVGDNDYLRTEASVPSHLWIMNARGGVARRLTRGTFSLSTIDPDVGSELSWSADGRYIAFNRLPNAIYGDSLGSVIAFYDLRAKRLRKLTTNSGLEGDPLFAPRGQLIAYGRPTNGDATAGSGVVVTRIGGGNGSDIRRHLDRSIDAKVWLPNAGALLLVGTDGPLSAMWVQPLNGPARHVALGNLDVAQVGNVASTGAIPFVASRSTHPSELFYLPSVNAKPVALTNENRFIDRIALGNVSSVNWRGPGGFLEDGILTTPPGFTRGRRYPLVLNIHGGPQLASTKNWNTRRLLIASRGYVVFEPNYRGSNNLGDRYERAISRDAGDGPGADAMAGVRSVLRMGFIDSNRIAVSGWSYGGYMTSWLEGHYHIWKAAVAVAALNDYFDDYNVSFYVNTDVPWFPGPPTNPKFAPMWWEQSPLAYAFRINTPTLIMHDTGDNNVTITNSYKMYHALKDRNVPVEFIAIPTEGHVPGDPVRLEDVLRHWIGWLDKYLK
ncbi:MAG: S9 family peptidase [Candidatus Eremiobacteraeota bacterium]|nr:S9 family peptidase [Candidatus Eremiobacteraeota bacterium]